VIFTLCNSWHDQGQNSLTNQNTTLSLRDVTAEQIHSPRGAWSMANAGLPVGHRMELRRDEQ
jgi:hypothetical protein